MASAWRIQWIVLQTAAGNACRTMRSGACPIPVPASALPVNADMYVRRPRHRGGHSPPCCPPVRGVTVLLESQADENVSVAKIEEGSPAYWSDLRVGDVITHVHSMAIETAGAFRSHGHGVVGTRLVLAVERGETFSLRVVLIRARTLRQAALACAKAYKNKVLQLLHDRLQGSQRLAHMHTTDAEARESPIHEKNANLDLERMQVSECTQWEMGTPAFHGLKGWLTTGRRLPAASGGESCRSFSGLAEVWHTLSRPDSDWEGAFVSQSPMASLPCCIRGVLW